MDASQKSVVSIDYLTVALYRSFNRQPPADSDVELRSVVGATNPIFGQVAEVWMSVHNQRVCVGELKWSPYSPILPANLCHFRFSGIALYCWDCIAILARICEAQSLVYSRISRCDVCADFNTFARNEHPARVISKLAEGRFHRLGRAKFKLYGCPAGEARGMLVGGVQWSSLTYGDIASGRQVCLYNKSLEMTERRHKQWIVDRWRQAGLDCGRDIWRLEFRLQGDAVRVLEPNRARKLSIFDVLLPSCERNRISILRALSDKLWDVRRVGVRSRLSNCPRVAKLPLCGGSDISASLAPPIARPLNTRFVRRLRDDFARLAKLAYGHPLAETFDSMIVSLHAWFGLPMEYHIGEEVHFSHYAGSVAKIDAKDAVRLLSMRDEWDSLRSKLEAQCRMPCVPVNPPSLDPGGVTRSKPTFDELSGLFA